MERMPCDNHSTIESQDRSVGSQITLTFIGKIRTWESLRTSEIGYLVLSIISICISFGMSIAAIINIDDRGAPEFTFAILLTLTTLFCFYYVMHGVLKERPFELMVFSLSIIIVTIYTTVNYVKGVQTCLTLYQDNMKIYVGHTLATINKRRNQHTKGIRHRQSATALLEKDLCNGAIPLWDQTRRISPVNILL